MVQTFVIKDAADEAQHKKCCVCKGVNKTCKTLYLCGSETCNTYAHQDCLTDAVRGQLNDNTEWCCSEPCKQEVSTAQTIAKAVAAAVGLQNAETERWKNEALALKEISEQSLKAINDLKSSFHEIQNQNRILNAKNQSLMSSTRHNYDQTVFATAADDTLFNTSALQSTMRRTIDQLHETVGASTSGASQVSNESHDPLHGKKFDSKNAPIEHAKTAYLLSLKEIRKTLGELPDFDGKGYEFLNFKTKFNAIKEIGKYNESQMIAKLEKALKGKALEHVRVWLFSPCPCAETIMRDLEEKFYHPNLIMQEALLKVTAFETMRKKDREQLEKFKRNVDAYMHVCTTVKESVHLNGRLPGEIEDKLPDDLCEEWLKHVNVPISTGSWFEFSVFLGNSVKFLKVRLPDPAKAKESKSNSVQKPKGHLNVAVETSSSQSSSSTSQSDGKKPNSNPKRNNNRSGSKNSDPKKVFVCTYDSCANPLYRCPEFLKLKLDMKLKFCEDANVCTKCLRKGHVFAYCTANYLPKCSVEGCTDPAAHTSAMHPPQSDKKKGNQMQAASNCQFSKGDISLFQVVPVLVTGKNGKQIEVTLFIDTGSNTSLISHDLYSKLGLNGTPYNFSVEWCAGGVKHTSMASHKTELIISPLQKADEKLVLRNIFTMANLKLPKQSQNARELKKMFPHLNDVDIPEYDEQRPQILLGLRHRHLTISSKVVLPPDERDSGIAELTRFGWVVSAVLSHDDNSNAVVRASEMDGSREEVTLEKLHELVKFFINLDMTSGMYRDRKFLSCDDERALEIQRATMKLVNNRYEIGFYWKSDDVVLPDNFTTALKRLKSTEMTLKKKNLVDWAVSHHNQLIDLGFARKATDADLNPAHPHQRVNYVIGFVVVNQNKTPPKPRWVVDTACKHEGVSLNSTLLKGPDNLVPLIQALFHFRERKYAIVADVEKMFHQVKIKEEDQQCQRFLWRDCDSSKPPSIYIYKVMLFGPTDSPSKANAIRIEHAENCKTKYPRASEAALDSMYMDDWFDSEDTVEEAVKTAEESIAMYAEISWKMTDFRSNSSEVLSELPDAHINQEVMFELLNQDITSICKVLGIYWNPKRDVFQFRQAAECDLKIDTLERNYRPSKRELLSFVMRIYDCLGLISHFIVRGRMILQSTWKEQKGWDDAISDEVFAAWKLWLVKFDELARLELPRHYGYVSTSVTSTQLHVFTDAGKDAYAAVCYFRFTFMDGSVKTTLVLSKARVAPLKHLSIPKLELKGAVLGSQLATVVRDQHKRMTIELTYYWSDSEVVLKWLRGFHLDLLPFVAPRIWEIRENTLVDNWNYCPSKENPADDGTKWNDIDFSDSSHRWYTGPKFLLEEEDKWPIEVDKPKAPTKVVNATRSLTPKSDYYAGVRKEVSSKIRANWESYRNVIALSIKFCKKLKAIRYKCRENNLIPSEVTVEELNAAEIFILKNVQESVWPTEYALVSRGKPLGERHSSALRAFDVFICSNGLMRTRTRMSLEETVPYDLRCPIMLPNSHETVDAIVRYAHEKNHHYGLEATCARLRAKYWILRTRQAVKRVISKCLHCKEMRIRPCKVPMGPLPSFRITPTSKAFERVGCDVFGPYKIYSGASKRSKEVYIVIFTCLVSRAVYLRRLTNLTSDDMLLAIQDLWTRRGPVKHIMSDNGKNFVGCANILNAEFRKRLAVDYSLKWSFNPAYTPQWGGAWERLIKDIKKAINAAMGGRILPERLFDTFLLQAEDIMNCRPLTHIPAHPNDEYPNTPNLLIKLHPGYSFLSEESEPGDGNCRLMLKRARAISSIFMAKFLKEYLPVITRAPLKGSARDTLKLGDLVIYCDPTCHPSNWKRGIIVNIYESRDGRARLADIKVRGGDVIEKRSAYRLAKLDLDDEYFNSSYDDSVKDNSLEEIFVNAFRAFTLHRGQDQFSVKLHLNAMRNARAQPTRAAHTLSISSSSNRSHIVNLYNSKIKKMLQINSIAKGSVINLITRLNQQTFHSSRDVMKHGNSSKALQIYDLQKKDEYFDDQNIKTLKLVSSEGQFPVAEILISLAAFRMQPRWISCMDAASRLFVVFVMLDQPDDADIIIDKGELQITGRKIEVMRPLKGQRMPIEKEVFEHTAIRWMPRENLDEWTMIISRRSNIPMELKSNGGPVRAAQLVGALWQHRLRNFYGEKLEEYRDARISEPKLSVAAVVNATANLRHVVNKGRDIPQVLQSVISAAPSKPTSETSYWSQSMTKLSERSSKRREKKSKSHSRRRSHHKHPKNPEKKVRKTKSTPRKGSVDREARSYTPPIPMPTQKPLPMDVDPKPVIEDETDLSDVSYDKFALYELTEGEGD